MKKIVLVTGANKGIGLEICKQLCAQNCTVILTSRDEKRGFEALKSTEGDIHYHQLDVSDLQSISTLINFVENKYGRLDVLINNAAILLDEKIPATKVKMELIRSTLETNLIGPFQLIQKFLPLLKKSKDGRIINMSSGLGAINQMASGYPGYRISKVGLNALTLILADELKGTNISVNTMTPGWVRTDMGGYNADLKVEQGADTAVWLATTKEKHNGKFFRERKEIDW